MFTRVNAGVHEIFEGMREEANGDERLSADRVGQRAHKHEGNQLRKLAAARLGSVARADQAAGVAAPAATHVDPFRVALRVSSKPWVRRYII